MEITYQRLADWESDFKIAPLQTDLAKQVIQRAPQLTEKGFSVVTLPARLYQEMYRRTITSYYLAKNIIVEDVKHDAISSKRTQKPEVCYEPDDFFGEVHRDPEVLKLHEQFAGVPLKPTHWYGPRVYHKGDLLREHVDHPTTHSIGSSVNIFCEGANDWPLVFRVGDSFAKVLIDPGEMVMFEAVRLPHSRPYRFEGDRYFAVFFHYFPTDTDIFSDPYLGAAAEYEKIM